MGASKECLLGAVMAINSPGKNKIDLSARKRKDCALKWRVVRVTV